MIAGWCYVLPPDIDVARSYTDDNGECEDYASRLQFELKLLLWTHIFCFVFCFAAEVYETSLGYLATLVGLCEYVCVLLSAGTMVMNVTLMFQYFNYEYEGRLECFKP